MVNVNRLFQSAFQISPVALSITNASTGRYVDVNESWLELFEFSREEVIGRTSKELNVFLENYAERETAVNLITRQGRVHHREINAHTKTGKLLSILYSAEIIPVDDEKYILSSTTDITERRKVEEAIRESEERFSKAFKSSPAALTITCVADNRLFDANETFLKLTGYRREEVIGHTTRELRLFLDQDKRDRLLAVVLKEGSVRNQEMEARTKTGQSLILLFSLEPIEVGGEKHILATYIDITESRKAEKALEQSEQLYRTLFENTEDGFQLFKPLYDEEGKPQDLLVLNVNKAYEQQTGLKASDVIGKKLKEAVPNLEPYWVSTYGNVAKTGKAVHVENYNQATDRWYDVYAFLYAKDQVGTLLRDITERKKAQDELKESAERLMMAQQIGHVGTFEWNIKTGINRWTPELEAMYGLPPGEFGGTEKAWEQLVYYEDRPEAVKLVSNALEKGSFEGEWRVKWPDGSIHWLFGRAWVFKDDSGKPLRLIGINIDITERKKSEEALRQSEERFFKAFHSNPAAMTIARLPDGRWVDANESFLRLTGHTRKEIIGHTSTELNLFLGSPAERAQIFKALNKQGHVDNIEINARTKTGKPLKLLLSAVTTFLNGQEYAITTQIDITERKKAEEAVKRQATLIDLSPDAIIVRTIEGVIQFWSKGAEKLYGYTEGEAIGKITHELFKTIFPLPLTEIVANLARTGSWNGELIHETKNRERVVVESRWLVQKDSEGQTSILESNVDITERKRNEDKLRRFATVLLDSNDSITMQDLNGKILAWNKGAEQMYGYTESEALGMNIQELVPMEDRLQAKSFLDAIRKGEETKSLEVRRKTKDGRLLDVWLTTTKLTDDHGKSIGIATTERDITERKIIEKQLQDKERLAAIGTTAGMVGHDIRNPLQAITSDTYLLKEELASTTSCKANESIVESIDSIEKNVAYINKIVQDLQDFSRPVTPEYSEVKVSSVFTSIFDGVIVPDTVHLSINIKGVETLRTDPVLFQRALTNIVNNAIQAMPKGGNLEIGSQPEAGRIVITVKDTGHGIPDEIKPKLFTPMMTTKAKGQGFGLAVSKRLIEAMNGTITFESEKGKGTTFTIELPDLKAHR